MFPLSVIYTLSLPESLTLSTANFMEVGFINCPFFMLTIFEVFAAATIKSVCLAKKAGI